MRAVSDRMAMESLRVCRDFMRLPFSWSRQRPVASAFLMLETTEAPGSSFFGDFDAEPVSSIGNSP